MKLKNIVFSLLVVGFGCGLGNATGLSGTVDDGNAFLEAPVASGTVSSAGKKRLMRIWASSDTVNFANWFVVCDSYPANSITDPSAFASDTYASPPMNFPISTTTVNSVTQPMYKIADYTPYGIVVSSWVYVFKSSNTSGAARRVFLEVR